MDRMANWCSHEGWFTLALLGHYFTLNKVKEMPKKCQRNAFGGHLKKCQRNAFGGHLKRQKKMI